MIKFLGYLIKDAYLGTTKLGQIYFGQAPNKEVLQYIFLDKHNVIFEYDDITGTTVNLTSNTNWVLKTN